MGTLSAPVDSYSYDKSTYLLTGHTDPLSHTESYGYSSTSRRLATITHADSTTTTLTAVQPIGLASGSGNTLSKPADAVGTLTDERSKNITFKVDRFGGAAEWTDQLSNKTVIVRNSNGFESKITPPDPDGGGALTSPVTMLGYNTAGDPVKTYQPDSSYITRTFDSSTHQLLTETDEVGREWTFTVDKYGNRTGAMDADGNTWTLTNDKYGRLTGSRLT